VSHRGFDIGDRVTVRVLFRLPPSAAQVTAGLPGDLTTPTVVVIRLQDPAGVTTLPAPTVVSVGTVEFSFTITARGTYTYRAEGTGVVTAAVEGEVVVRPSRFYP
jgi:hypothetical protein